jgi:hypothetical protein
MEAKNSAAARLKRIEQNRQTIKKKCRPLTHYPNGRAAGIPP